MAYSSGFREIPPEYNAERRNDVLNECVRNRAAKTEKYIRTRRNNIYAYLTDTGVEYLSGASFRLMETFGGRTRKTGCENNNDIRNVGESEVFAKNTTAAPSIKFAVGLCN